MLSDSDTISSLEFHDSSIDSKAFINSTIDSDAFENAVITTLKIEDPQTWGHAILNERITFIEVNWHFSCI